MGSSAPGRKMPTALSTSAEKPIAYFLPVQIHLEPLFYADISILFLNYVVSMTSIPHLFKDSAVSMNHQGDVSRLRGER